MILADVAFPALCAVLAWVLTGYLTRAKAAAPRDCAWAAICPGILLNGLLDHLAVSRVCRQDPLVAKRAVRLALGPLRSTSLVLSIVPDYASPFLTLFRHRSRS